MFYIDINVSNNITSKKKRHSPDPSKLEFDKVAMLTEVNGLAEGSPVSIIPHNLIHVCNMCSEWIWLCIITLP